MNDYYPAVKQQEEVEVEEEEEEEESRSFVSILKGVSLGGGGDNNNNNTDKEDDTHASPRSSSSSLVVSSFFENVWQESCAIFRNGDDNHNTTTTDNTTTQLGSTITPFTAAEDFNEERLLENPYKEIVRNGVHVLMDLMNHVTSCADATDNNNNNNNNKTLLFQNCQIVPPEIQMEKYAKTPNNTNSSSSSWSYEAAFLDGCSIVVNHADVSSVYIGALCNDLQRSFPHAYANTYWTPPNAQTVPAHADDRDVLVIQVYGEKHWKVYQNIPIPYPYPHEQVGKRNHNNMDDDDVLLLLPVPEEVLNGPVLIDTILRPGDVLYMPRGYVHQAKAAMSTTTSTSTSSSSSFHITVALATHDWSLAGLLSDQASQLWKSVIPLRRAVDRNIGRTKNNNNNKNEHYQQSLQQEINQAMQFIQQRITAQSIQDHLEQKYNTHNQRAAIERQRILEQKCHQQQKSLLLPLPTTTTTNIHPVTGPLAAVHVFWDTLVRAATPEEKENFRQQQIQQQLMMMSSKCQQLTPPQPQPGLHVRNEIFNEIVQILDALKEQQQQQHGEKGGVAVSNLKQLLVMNQNDNNNNKDDNQHHSSSSSLLLLCGMTMLCFARRCVELGAMIVVDDV